jgi:hypothetical protein
MTAVFIILAIIFIVAGTLLFVHYSSYLPPIACFIFALLLICGSIISSENVKAKLKVETLSEAGITPLDADTVYNKSQAELDKLYKVVTLDGTYYYIFEKDTN